MQADFEAEAAKMNNMLGDRLAERKAMESAHAEALAKLQAALDTETAGHTEKAAALEAAQAEIESLRRELAASEERLAAASRGSEAASAQLRQELAAAAERIKGLDESKLALQKDVQKHADNLTAAAASLKKTEEDLKITRDGRATDQKKSAQAMRETEASHKKALEELERKLRAAEGDSAAELSKLRSELEAARRQQESTEQVLSPKLTVGFSQSSDILMTYRVVAGARGDHRLHGGDREPGRQEAERTAGRAGEAAR